MILDPADFQIDPCVADPSHQDHSHDDPDPSVVLLEAIEAAECDCGSLHPDDIRSQLQSRGFDIAPILTVERLAGVLRDADVARWGGVPGDSAEYARWAGAILSAMADDNANGA